jgi:hypothetical protein
VAGSPKSRRSKPVFTRDEIEAALIDGHWRYGGLIHREAADVFATSLRTEPSTQATGHALLSRLFGEYAASLETHGAWAWAMRNRFRRGTFIDAYLDYMNRDVHAFYEFVRGHEGDVTDLLRLPPTDRIVEVAAATEMAFSADEFRAGLDARYARLKIAADLWFGHEGILIQAYNKTKHGAPMVRMTTPDDPRRFEFVVPDRQKQGDDRYRLVMFTLSRKTIDTLSNNVESMTASITELAGLTRLLSMVGLLYEQA